MKKKIELITIIVVIIVIALIGWLQQPRTLADIMKGNVPVEEFEVTYKTKVNGEYDINRLWVRNSVGVKEIWKVLQETKVSSMRVTFPPKDLKEGEAWYEVGELYNLNWVQIMNNGKVYSEMPLFYQLNTVFTISNEELQKCTVALREIMEEYGEE